MGSILRVDSNLLATLADPAPRLSTDIPTPSAATSGASLDNARWFDLARRAWMPLTGNFIPITTPYGRFMRPAFDGTTKYFTAGLSIPADLDVSPGILSSLLIHSGPVGNTSTVYFRHNLVNGTSGGQRVRLEYNGASAGLRIMLPSSSGTSDSSTAILSGQAAAGLHHVALYVEDGYAAGWVDGELAVAQSWGSKAWPSTSNYNGLYGDEGSGTEGDVAVIHQLFWQRANRTLAKHVAEDWRRVYAPRRIWVPVSAGGSGITVALSGISATFAQTAPAVSSTTSLVGEGAAASAGVLLPVFSRTLSGESAAFAAGSVIPSVAIAAIGLQAAFTAGTLTASSSAGSTVALTGESATFAQTAPSTSVTIALTGIAATMAAGILSSSSGTATITVKAGSWLRYKKLQ